MFWKTKTTPPTPKQALILKAYLSGSMALVSHMLSNPAVKAGLCVYILGMADMLRQSGKLSWEEFIAIYEATLSEYGLLPTMPVKNLVETIGRIASSNQDIDSLMRQGAQSIRTYIVDQDADAPSDLIGAAHFAEQAANSFSKIVSS